MPRALTRSSTESAEMPWIFGNLDQLIVPRQAGLPGSADVLVALADVRMRQATAKIEGDQAGVLRSGRTPRLRRQRRGQRRDPLERPGPPPRSAGGLRAGYVGRIRAIPASSLSCERAAQARAKPDLRGQRIAAQPPGPPSASPAPPPHPPRARPHRRGC